jgi:hypothetical protein
MSAGSSRSAQSAVSVLAGALALSAGLCLDQTPARAGNNPFGGLGGFVGGVVGGVVGGAAPSQPRYRPAGTNRNSGAPRAPQSAEPPPSPADSARALAALAPPSSQDQIAMLKSVNPSDSLGAVGATDDLEQVGKAADDETGRDYTGKIDDLIKRIQVAQNAQRTSKEGDVTEHAILESLDGAIRSASLQRFETFLGENWSPERLRVMILDRANNEIGGLFEGTNRGVVTMNDLDTIIKKSARNVFARLFETSELLAANRGSTLFVQRLYQAHGDLVSGDVRESAEQLLDQASASGVAQVEPLLRRDPDAFALRYRAERIVFDCLSDNVEAISASDSGMATSAEIAKRVLDVGQQQCSKWVATQLIGPDGRLKPQDPMPLRVLWTADGPKDDPSMYGHATDQL